MSELEDLLLKHRLEGQLDSVGEFTVDPEKEAAKLREYLLPDPHAYVLKLVQWAVQCKARSIRVDITRNKIIFAHDGDTESQETLINWKRGLSHPASRVYDLAVAMATLSSLKPTRVTFANRGAEEALDVVFDQGECKTRQGSSDPAIEANQPLTMVSIEGRQLVKRSALNSLQEGFAQGIFAQAKFLFQSSLFAPEKVLLEAACCHCPCPISINGVYVNRPFFGYPNSVDEQPTLNFGNPEVGTRNWRAYRFWYLLDSTRQAGLFGPARHSEAISVAWSPPAKEITPKVRLNRKTREQPQLGQYEAHDLDYTINNAVPISLWAMMMEKDSPALAPAGRVVEVINGVSIGAQTERLVSDACLLVISGQGLQTDVCGLSLVKNTARVARIQKFLNIQEALKSSLPN